MLESLSYLVVHLTPTVLVLACAITVLRAVGLRIVWREDE